MSAPCWWCSKCDHTCPLLYREHNLPDGGLCTLSGTGFWRSSGSPLWKWPSSHCLSQKKPTGAKETEELQMLCPLIQTRTFKLWITCTVMIAIFSICSISFHGLRPLARYFSQGFIKKYLSLRLKSSTTFVWKLWMWTLHLQFSLRSSDLAASSCSRSSIALRVWDTVPQFMLFFILSKIKTRRRHRKAGQPFQSFWCLSNRFCCMCVWLLHMLYFTFKFLCYLS